MSTLAFVCIVFPNTLSTCILLESDFVENNTVFLMNVHSAFLPFRVIFVGIANAKAMMNRPQFGQSISQQGFFSTSRDSISPPCATRTTHTHVSATASEMDLSRKNRRTKERGRLKGGEQPLLDSWNRTGARGSMANTLATNASSNHLSSAGGVGVGAAGATGTVGGCNGTDR